MRMRTMATVLVFGLALIALGHPSWQAPTVLERPTLSAYTEEDEIRVGRQQFEGITRALSLNRGQSVQQVSDPLILSHLYMLQSRLLQALPERYGRPTRYPIVVIDLGITNAWAIMGGYLVITLGEIIEWKSDDQGMMLMGHEIGHILLNHPAHYDTLDAVLNEKAASLFRSIDEENAKAVHDPVRVAVLNLLLQELQAEENTLNLDRQKHETEADLFAVQLCLAAGCDPEDKISKFEAGTSDPGRLHPPGPVRARFMRQEVLALRRGRPWPYKSQETPEFITFQLRAMNLLLNKWFPTP